MLATAIGGCGGSSGHRAAGHSRTATAPTTTTGTGTNPTPALRVQPVSDLEMVTGSPAHQIRATVKAFYRAAWQNDPQQACALFSAQGSAGFIDAAKTSFPASVNQFSTCETVMKIYSAALQDSVQNLQQDDPTLTGDNLNNVTIGDLVIHGNSATATGPLNALPMINPRQLFLVRSSGRWLMNGEKTPKKNVQGLLKEKGKSRKR